MDDVAIDILNNNAEKIFKLIDSQKTHLCLAQCPAFEEIIDTQLFGFSKQVEFAIEIGILQENEGHQMMSKLERALNDVYTQVYNEMYQSNKIKTRPLEK